MLDTTKQRRSRIDWSEILPRYLVYQQEAIERKQTALAMRRAGMKLREIGEAMGVCKERARSLIAQAERWNRRCQLSPAERMFAGLMEPSPTPTEKKKLATYLGGDLREG